MGWYHQPDFHQKNHHPFYFDVQMLEHDRQSLDVYAHASSLELKVWISLEVFDELNFNGKKKSYLKTGEIVSLFFEFLLHLLGKDIPFWYIVDIDTAFLDNITSSISGFMMLCSQWFFRGFVVSLLAFAMKPKPTGKTTFRSMQNCKILRRKKIPPNAVILKQAWRHANVKNAQNFQETWISDPMRSDNIARVIFFPYIGYEILPSYMGL